MAQRVQAVPNPRYSTAPLETTGATIVSNRRVLVPPIIQGTFKGQRDYSGSNLNYITFQIADNECFIDNKCLFLIGDLTVYGPNAKDNSSANSSTASTYGRDLYLEFDQSSNALFSQITIGSPQGLKWEEIMSYNLYCNMIALHTEHSVHKERELLHYTSFSKDTGKDYGLQHFTDQQWRSPCRLAVGETTRIAVRFHMYSDFMQNIDLFPLFLLRNGLQITLYLESAFKVFYSPCGSSRNQDLVVNHNIFTASPPYVICPNTHFLDKTAVRIPAQAANAAGGVAQAPGNILPIPTVLTSMHTGTAAIVPSYNAIWLHETVYSNLYNQLKETQTAFGKAGNAKYFGCDVLGIPVTMVEFNQVVWSGFAVLGCSNYGKNFVIFDQYLSRAGAFVRFPTATADLEQGRQIASQVESQYMSLIIFTRELNNSTATDILDASFETKVQNEQQFVPQLDYDQRKRVDFGVSGVNKLNEITLFRGAIGGTNDVNYVNTGTHYHGLALYSYHDVQPIPYINFNADDLANSRSAQAEANNSLTYRGAQAIFHCGDAFVLHYNLLQDADIEFAEPPLLYTAAATATALTAPANLVPTVVLDPTKNGAASMVSLWSLPAALRTMRYEITNPQLLLDLVKPDAENFLKWQQAFSSPNGIAIKFKKPIYRKLSFATQASGLLQIQVPINVRSLTGIMFVLQDPALDTEPNDLLQCLALANLSTFQNRRLTEQYIQIGGQQYPIYLYQMLPDGQKRPYWQMHVLELEKFFAVAGNNSFNSCLTAPMIKKTRNMLAGGYLGAQSPLVAASFNKFNRCTYTDASGAVYGMNLAKDWVRTFTTGVDSSQAGSIAINLYFKDCSGVSNISAAFGGASTGNATASVGSRQFNVHMFAMCDAVGTLQESANLVRY